MNAYRPGMLAQPVPDPIKEASQGSQAVATQAHPAGCSGSEIAFGSLAQQGYRDADAVRDGNAFGSAVVHVTGEQAHSRFRIEGDQAMQYKAPCILEEHDVARSREIRGQGGDRHAFPGTDGWLHAVAMYHRRYGFPLLQESRDDVAGFQHRKRNGFFFV